MAGAVTVVCDKCKKERRSLDNFNSIEGQPCEICRVGIFRVAPSEKEKKEARKYKLQLQKRAAKLIDGLMRGKGQQSHAYFFQIDGEDVLVSGAAPDKYKSVGTAFMPKAFLTRDKSSVVTISAQLGEDAGINGWEEALGFPRGTFGKNQGWAVMASREGKSLKDIRDGPA